MAGCGAGLNRRGRCEEEAAGGSRPRRSARGAHHESEASVDCKARSQDWRASSSSALICRGAG